MQPEVLESLERCETGLRVKRALERLLEQDAYLLKKNVNERSITFRLGFYLQEEFIDRHVDCEYNRDGEGPKCDDSEAGKTVVPDIIVHHRGTCNNHLVIEVKKSGSQQLTMENDRVKLGKYKIKQGYVYAMFVVLKVGDEPDVLCAEWIDGLEGIR